MIFWWKLSAFPSFPALHLQGRFISFRSYCFTYCFVNCIKSGATKRGKVKIATYPQDILFKLFRITSTIVLPPTRRRRSISTKRVVKKEIRKTEWTLEMFICKPQQGTFPLFLWWFIQQRSNTLSTLGPSILVKDMPLFWKRRISPPIWGVSKNSDRMIEYGLTINNFYLWDGQRIEKHQSEHC